MFKNTRGFLFAVVSTLALSACGGGSVGGGDGNPDPGGGTGEVTAIGITVGATQLAPTRTAVVRATLSGGPAAIAGKTVTFSSTAGSFNSVTATTNASGIAERTFTAPGEAGRVTVTVTGAGFSNSGSILVVPGSAANVELEPLPNRVPLGGVTRLQALVTDAFGNAVDGVTVRFSAPTNNTGGRYASGSTVLTDFDGFARVDYTAGTTPGSDVLRALATGGAAGTASVNASAANAAPGSIVLSMGRTTLDAGGSSTSATALVTDESGAAIQGVTVGFSATGGTIPASGVTNASGRAVVAYSPPPTGGTFTVRGEIGALSSEQQVIVAGRPQNVSRIDLLVSSNDLSSAAQSAATGVTITAVLLDAENKIIPAKEVSFSASSGVLTPLDAGGTVTDAAGQVRIALTVGTNPRNRPITVTARAGDARKDAIINVVGTRFSTIEGPSALRAGASEGNSYTVRLQDSASNGIAGEQVRFFAYEDTAAGQGTTPVLLGTVPTASTPRGEATITVSPRTGVTQLRLYSELVTQAGELALRSLEFPIVVNSRILSFLETGSAGASLAQIPINTNQSVVVSLREAAAGGGTTPVAGAVIRLSVTRGNIIGATDVATNAAGRATFTVFSSNSGPVTIAALTVADGLSITRQTTFIATTPSKVVLQASPATIGTNSTSEIRATILDANDNRVVGQTVNFSIVTDPTNGSLSSTTAVTNDVGVASVNYRSSSVASARDGVTVRASVPGVTPATTTLTVGNQSLRIALGTSNVVGKDGDTRYKLPYLAIVRDAAGNPVPEAEFTLNVRPLFYLKGEKIFADPTWVVESTAASCRAEDIDDDGFIDAGEDINGNGVLDPSDGANVPRTIALRASDASAEFDVTYPRDRSYWVVVELSAIARVGGTEAIERAVFTLPGAAEDYNKEDVAPPGQISPFGVVKDCTVADSGGYAKFTTTSQIVDTGGTVTVTVNLEGLVNKQVTVPVFASWLNTTDASNSTITPQSTSIVIPAGQLSGSATFTVTNTITTGRIIPITLSISKPLNAEVGFPSTQTINVRP